MASITYTSLSTLQPIELKYQFYKNEELKNTKISYKNGYTVYQTNGLLNYQDTSINRETSFILTSAINLEQIFSTSENYNLGKLPGSFLIQPRQSLVNYGAYSSETNSIVLSSAGSQFYISPVPNSNEVEIFIGKKYLQVEENYPYRVTTSSRTLPLVSIHRQRFDCVYGNSTITFKTKTKEGYRYLAFGNDQIMRATGTVFNNSLVQDYAFKCILVTTDNLVVNSDLKNPWITYFLSFNQEQQNKTVAVNKQFLIPTNLLIDFSIEKAAKTGKANINIANLKTGVTPFGGPAPVDNTTPL